ncbi:MAG: Arc family DNA-binding protein [Oscillibacter sp.]|nr:Arc family DNA-binding protein [Oscillibacter sp.]
MPASKAQQKAVSKYMKENYDMYQIRMPKGKKETIQTAAAAIGQSVNAYINQAIDERMNRDSAGTVSNAPVSPSEGGSAPGGAHVPGTPDKP